MDETRHGQLCIEFGTVPRLKSADMVDGAQVRFSNSPPVMVIWPRGLYLTPNQRQAFKDRLTEAAETARKDTQFIAHDVNGPLREFMILIENDPSLAQESDEELYYSLTRG